MVCKELAESNENQNNLDTSHGQNMLQDEVPWMTHLTSEERERIYEEEKERFQAQESLRAEKAEKERLREEEEFAQYNAYEQARLAEAGRKKLRRAQELAVALILIICVPFLIIFLISLKTPLEIYSDQPPGVQRTALTENTYLRQQVGTDAQNDYEAGLKYYNSENYAEALKWFRKAANQGNADAQTFLGIMYSFGQVVTKDYAEAVKWYRKAADQGDAAGQVLLGGMYYYGKGVPQDYEEAVKWYLKSANQGRPLAQISVGWMYYYGEGVAQNMTVAKNWFCKAVAQGSPLSLIPNASSLKCD